MALLNSFTSGVSAVKTFGKSLEVIGDNIANVNTTGFKGSRMTNQDNFSQTLERSSAGVAGAAGASGTNAMQVGGGTSVASISQQFTQGVLSTTGGPADLGVAGKGFFKVYNTKSTEYLYTRAGDFRLDDAGHLLTNQGLKLVGATQTTGITIPPLNANKPLASYSIDNAGYIKAYYSGNTAPVAIDQILLTTFSDPNALERVSGNLLKNPGVNGANAGAAGATLATIGATATQAGEIKQGTLELSNVDLTQQFSDLILAQRAFQAGSRIITVSDSVMEEIINLKR